MLVKHQQSRRRKWQNAQRTVRTHLPSHLPALLFLTDPERTPNPAELIRYLPRDSGLVYRHFGACDRVQIGHELQRICRRRGLKLLIGGDPKLAKVLNADGVHWPERRLREALKWRRAFALQTASAHSLHAITAARRTGLDAVLLSTVFASNSPSARRPIGALRFRQLCRKAPMAVYGLGGIRAETAGQIATCSGLAAIDGLYMCYNASKLAQDTAS